MDNDENKDGQADIPEVSHDELAIGSTRGSDANELVVVLTEKEVQTATKYLQLIPRADMAIAEQTHPSQD